MGNIVLTLLETTLGFHLMTKWMILTRKGQEEKVKKITTDGQHFAFDISGQKQMTIDIGFNFFEVNQKFLSFRSRGKYD